MVEVSESTNNLVSSTEPAKEQTKKAAISNCFFIQKAAIDILLLNGASAIEICAYLVICKYTDKNGFFSGVGYQTIKERLGIGQRKAQEAMHRLTQMKLDGHRLLYHVDEWIQKKVKNTAVEIKTGWVRPWINSNYQHNIWINNTLVGNHKSPNRPLNFFCKTSSRDAHARLLILLLKFYTKSYSAVHYKLACIATSLEEEHKQPTYTLKKSRIFGYSTSGPIVYFLKGYTEQPVKNILKDLVDNQFFYADLLVLTDTKFRFTKRKRKGSAQRPESKKNSTQFFWLKTEINDDGSIAVQRKPAKYAKDYIDLSEWVQMPLVYSRNGVAEERKFTKPVKYLYRVDVKNVSGKPAKPKNCLGAKIKSLAVGKSITERTKRQIFRNVYWWLAPNNGNCHFIGVFASIYVPATTHKNESNIIKLFKRNKRQATINDDSDIL